jgi:hypothetical protein
MSDEMVETDKPTALIGPPLCQHHCNNYKLSDWLSASEYKHIKEGAEARGFRMPDMALVRIEFKPVGWIPRGYLEVERG